MIGLGRGPERLTAGQGWARVRHWMAERIGGAIGLAVGLAAVLSVVAVVLQMKHH